MKPAALTTTLACAVAPVLAAVGGRCASNYGANCICLNKNTCRNTYGGRAEEGSAGNWPCPSDGNDIWGCFVNNCKGSSTVCQWKDFCASSSFGTVLPVQG
ncbi:hypothetical protein OOU_Y34scaffold00448g38 [Pyricularia oryzae Y34]|uniref:Uncharacterized protein n=2 Tax=Pyricularia oryzae TaxID=318829 RepID=A0AA97P1Q5_PYRO3|nr:hypothetical protein OOU_Y34scaffold00448g38 [Pyricularia oryzae Y34]